MAKSTCATARMSTAVISLKSPQLRANICHPFQLILIQYPLPQLHPFPRVFREQNSSSYNRPTTIIWSNSISPHQKLEHIRKGIVQEPGALTTKLEASVLPGHPHGGHPSASLSPNWTNPKSSSAPHRTSTLKYGISTPFSHTLVVTWRRWSPFVNFSSSTQIQRCSALVCWLCYHMRALMNAVVHSQSPILQYAQNLRHNQPACSNTDSNVPVNCFFINNTAH